MSAIDPQAEFEATHRLTDFSELWRLQGQGAEPEPEVEIDRTIGLVRHTTEKVTMTVTKPMRLGQHRWSETQEITVFRTVRPS